MASPARMRSLFDLPIVLQAVVNSFRKLTPQREVRNPVMFVVYVGSILTTLLWAQAVVGKGEAPAWFIFWVSMWLWFTVLFANFAEAMAEGRGKAQAASRRKARRDLQAKRLARPQRSADFQIVPATSLRKGQFVLVEAGESVPVDGTVVEGVASVNEAAITGESAPVIRESGGDRSAVTGGTQVLSDWLIVEVTANPGEAFLDRMIQKNVIAMSGRAVEAAGDVDVLLLDKTGTITLGNRQATQFAPAPGVAERDLADAAQLASLADETPEGRSIVVLAKEKYGLRGRDIQELHASFVPFAAQTRMSGVDLNGRHIRKGAADAIECYVRDKNGAFPTRVREHVET